MDPDFAGAWGMKSALLLVPLALTAGTLAACGSDGAPVAIDRIRCEALGVNDSYHYSSHTAFVVSGIAGTATPNPVDLPPFSVAWDVEADLVEGGERRQATVKISDAGSQSETTVIEVGTDSWNNFGPGTDFAKREDGTSLPFPPNETCQALVADLDLASMTGAPEKVNGISSMKYEIDALPSAALADVPSIGPGADAVTVIKEYSGMVWVASDGYISKLDLSGTGDYEGGRRAMNVELAYEYSDINGVDIEIVAPVPR